MPPRYFDDSEGLFLEASSMTQRSETVEPPLASRSVQCTLLGVLAISLAWLLIASYRQSAITPPSSIEGLGREVVLLRIDLNHAEPRELALLPGVGPVLASRIAEHRRRSGPFRAVEDLVRVAGIGPKKLDQIREIGVVTSIPPIQDRADRLASRKALEDPPRRGSFDPASR